MELSDAGLRKQLTLLKEQINQKCQEEAEKAEKIGQEAREAMQAAETTNDETTTPGDVATKHI